MRARSVRLLVIGLALVGCRSESSATPVPSESASASAVAPPVGPTLEFIVAAEGDVAARVKDELTRARTQGRKLVVYVGATWCEPCRRFHDAASKGAFDARLPRVRFLEFDLDRDKERLAEAGYVSEYIPLFALPSDDGRASGKQIAGSVKGAGAPDEIAPRLDALLSQSSAP